MRFQEAHEGEVNAVRWGSSGQFFATGGTDRKLKFWEVQGGWFVGYRIQVVIMF
jgi:WD40 repeat protein